jgi:hypothetical protein
VAAGLLAALPVGWYLGSPWWTLWRMREAARAGDMQTLGSYVDRAAVWKATKRAAEAELLGALARAGTAKTTDERAYAIAVANDLRRQLRGESEVLKDTVEAIPYRPTELAPAVFGLNPRIERRGLSEFVIRSPSTPSPGTFIFRRHGLGWKLHEVQWGWP